MDTLVDFLSREKDTAASELRAYTELMFKTLPVVTTIVIAVVGISSTEGRAALWLAVPFLIDIVMLVLILLGSMLQLTDGYVRYLERAINVHLRGEILFKNMHLYSWLWGTRGAAGYCWELFAVLVVMLLNAALIYAYASWQAVQYLLAQRSAVATIWAFGSVVILTPVVLLIAFAVIHSRLDSVVLARANQALAEIKDLVNEDDS